MRRQLTQPRVSVLAGGILSDTARTQSKRTLSGSAAECPCGWSEVRRSKTHWYELPLSFALKALRCERCGLRFWRMRRRSAAFVWMDSYLDILNAAVIRNPTFWIIVLIIVAAATGAGLGYVLSLLSAPEAVF